MNQFVTPIALMISAVIMTTTAIPEQQTQQAPQATEQQSAKVKSEVKVHQVESKAPSSWTYNFVIWNGGHTYKVIPQAKLPKSKVGKKVGEVKRQLKKGQSPTRTDGDSTLPAGTKIYQFKYGPSKGAFIVGLNGEYVKAVRIK